MKPIEIVRALQLASPAGHYSQAVVHDGIVYVSGQLGRGPQMSDAEAGDIEAQTRRSLEQVAAILRASGSEPGRLLKVNVYITSLNHWPVVDDVYREILGQHRPARCVLAVAALHYGALVEIDATAAAA
jgi:reactive intermediate/imine deaminase